jgi:hypothetical protein
MFRKAEKKGLYLRMALIGPPGSGKSFTALRLAMALANGGPVAAIDSERGSLYKYAGEENPDGGSFSFDVDELSTFAVKNYITAIQEAVKAGYKALIIDSLSHAWAGQGGILEFVDNKKGKDGNAFDAWRVATPLHNQLIDTIIGAKLHVIVTMRAKTEYIMEKDDKGKTSIRKVGMQPIQREGLEYEFDVIADMDGGTMFVSKTRCPALTDKRFYQPGKDVATVVSAWLQGGKEEPPKADPPKQSTAPAIGPSWPNSWPDRIGTSEPATDPEWSAQVAEKMASLVRLEDLNLFLGSAGKLPIYAVFPNMRQWCAYWLKDKNSAFSKAYADFCETQKVVGGSK